MAQTLGTERDARHLMRAIELAAEARGMTSPNPLVGAVVVKDGRVIGEGFHAAAGLPHAERVALDACSENPARATLYVSLEPCCHDGRTPPCTDAIVEAGEASRARAHRWRAELDAVAIGIGTAVADDPLLTARVEAVPRQPRRVVFDSEARLPLGSSLLRSVDEAPVIVVVSRAAARTRTQALAAAGAEVITVSGENEAARVRAALDELGSRDVQSLLLEGGPHLAGAFLDAGEVDQMRVFVAPIVAGGRAARSPIEGQGFQLIGAARRALAHEVEEIGDDVLISARLTEW